MKLLKQIKQQLLSDKDVDKLGPHFNKLSEKESITLRFYKSPNEYWYVDMPEWEGTQGALEMVRGADELLDVLSGGLGDDVFLQISITAFEDCERLIKIQDDTVAGGAYYGYSTVVGPKLVWLCSVSDWYFGYHPDEIYFKSINK